MTPAFVAHDLHRFARPLPTLEALSMNLQKVLGRVAERLDASADRRAALTLLVDAGLDRLPGPGHGTLARWQALACVASCDLSLVKLYEGHTDALAILAEVDAEFDLPARARWGTWASESPNARVTFDVEPAADGRVRLAGVKAWCSGATAVTHGLLTAWHDDRGPWLVVVAMDQPGVRVTDAGWRAVGMVASGSVDVQFDDAVGVVVGRRGAYVDRPGFWQGGCGLAACWHGGAVSIGDALRRSVASGRPEPHKLAALGEVDMILSRNAALLREGAAWIDANPHGDAKLLALRLRAASDEAAANVLQLAGRALGAAPYCRDARFARMAADLPVYIRQCHAERDLAVLGAVVADATTSSRTTSWAL